MGPILFTLYTQHLSNIIQKHQSEYHKYADDTELEKAALPSDFSQVSRETEVCVADVNDWMNKNKLKLSEEKTELLVVGDCTHLCQAKKEPLTFGPNAGPFQTSSNGYPRLCPLFNENYKSLTVCAHASGRLLRMITFQWRVGISVHDDFI